MSLNRNRNPQIDARRRGTRANSTLVVKQALILWLMVLVFPETLVADAIVATKAMKASTIAEIFIEDTVIRLELEIATGDLPAFRNILPDKLYQKLLEKEDQLTERARRFVREDFLLKNESGKPLTGSLLHSKIRARIIRDEVTGEPLAQQPDDTELVLLATLEYTFNERPKSLTIQPPLKSHAAAASIGFVCYHQGLAVNDFRYLPGSITLDLDWEDPWFSRFRHPNFRRQFDAPLSAYLYVEPYEVRKEIILRPKDMETWLDLDLPADGLLPVNRQEKLKKDIADFLLTRNPVTIDGTSREGQLDRIHFIRRTLRSTGIIEPAEDQDLHTATLGVIIVYPVGRLPDTVSMEWELYGPKIQTIPAVASDEAGGLPTELTPDDPVLVWKNYLKSPSTPQLQSIDPPPEAKTIEFPLLSLAFGGAFMVSLIAAGWRKWNGRPLVRGFWIGVLGLFVLSLVMIPYAKISLNNPLEEEPALEPEEAETLLKNLLHNVYISFDHHDDSLVYDRLATSISGDLLERVYLETRRSMEIKNQGGLRISVKNIDIVALAITEQVALETTVRCRWRVAGWIGHWGHIHQRVNEHQAMITIAPREEKWKVIKIEMLDEIALASGSN